MIRCLRRSVRVRGAALAGMAGLSIAACRGDEPDAYGHFEATEVTVSAEVGGRLIRFEVAEGGRLAAGSVVGLIDTIEVALEIAEVRAQHSASQARTAQAAAQVGVLEAELRSAERELARAERLYAGGAATEQQLEQAGSRVEVLRERIRAAREQTTGSREEAGATEARLARLRDRLRRSQVRNPTGGTVLTTYARAGEFVQPGQRLYTVADLDTVVLRAYLSGAQLGRVRLGQPVRVRFDAGPGELGALPGAVSWISASAEFTPTPIQTRDERVDLVYAIEVRVPNPDGVLKLGMPGEVELLDRTGPSPTASR